jgi:signal transduction histidine kinase
MWKKLLIIYLIFGLSLAILIALSLYAFQRFNAYVKHAEAVERDHHILNRLNELRIHLGSLTTYQRNYLLFSDSTYLTDFDHKQSEIVNTFADLYQLIREDPEQRKRMAELNFNFRSQLDYLRSGIIAGYPPTDHKIEKKHIDRSVEVLGEMELAEKNRMDDMLATRLFYEETTPQNFRIVFVFTLTIFIISFALLAQQYRDRLKYQRQLEHNIIELNQANAEWDQIAYVASHDLQEPVRKIRTFTDLLLSKYKNVVDPEAQALLKKIDASSHRAQSLIIDIVNYNTIVYSREKLQSVDLDETISDLLSDLRGLLLDKNASVRHDGLPVIQGYPSQLRLLFQALIDNSLKFNKPDEFVKVTLSYTDVSSKSLPFEAKSTYKSYYKITYEDNGIGFDNQFSEKIFKMFQRLHPQESPYEGRGIGLAMAKRIMANHSGYIVARGRPGIGSRFTLYFPAR